MKDHELEFQDLDDEKVYKKNVEEMNLRDKQ